MTDAQILSGKARVFGDDINTDYIISSSRKKETIDPAELSRYLFETLDPSFAASLDGNDIIVGGQNFGCGSAMEVAVTALLGGKVRCVIAKSFARTYFRNAINNGLLPIACDTGSIEEGDPLRVETTADAITVFNESTGSTLSAVSYPPVILSIVSAGGLIPFLKAHGRLSLAS